MLTRARRSESPYDVRDLGIEFTSSCPEGTYFYEGTIKPDGLELGMHSGRGEPKLHTTEFVFIPLPEEAFTHPGYFIDETLSVAGNSTPFRVQLGKGRPENDCPFTPFRDATEYPPGTTAIAYRVYYSSDRPVPIDVEVRMAVRCRSSSVMSKRCNEFATIMGVPVNYKWTSIQTCGDGGPFEPGTYTLQLWVEGALIAERTFEVK
ncbi:hypothetical protein ACFL3Z_02520 [Gemmatimonadota bacterium]